MLTRALFTLCATAGFTAFISHASNGDSQLVSPVTTATPTTYTPALATGSRLALASNATMVYKEADGAVMAKNPSVAETKAASSVDNAGSTLLATDNATSVARFVLIILGAIVIIDLALASFAGIVLFFAIVVIVVTCRACRIPLDRVLGLLKPTTTVARAASTSSRSRRSTSSLFSAASRLASLPQLSAYGEETWSWHDEQYSYEPTISGFEAEDVVDQQYGLAAAHLDRPGMLGFASCVRDEWVLPVTEGLARNMAAWALPIDTFWSVARYLSPRQMSEEETEVLMGVPLPTRVSQLRDDTDELKAQVLHLVDMAQALRVQNQAQAAVIETLTEGHDDVVPAIQARLDRHAAQWRAGADTPVAHAHAHTDAAGPIHRYERVDLAASSGTPSYASSASSIPSRNSASTTTSAELERMMAGAEQPLPRTVERPAFAAWLGPEPANAAELAAAAPVLISRRAGSERRAEIRAKYAEKLAALPQRLAAREQARRVAEQ